VLFGQTAKHKQYVFGEMTTRGIINAPEHFGIRSIRSKKFKYVWNFTPDVKFQNACTQSDIFESWRQKAATDPDAADKVRRYEHRAGEELYDIIKDPYEWNNLADNPKYAQVKTELRNRLLDWMRSTGDKGQQTELEAPQHQAKNRNKKAQGPVKKRREDKGKDQRSS
jgi:uncharacterized sulfatase